MPDQTAHRASHGNPVGNHTPNCIPASKWAAIANDKLVWMPERHVHITALREQAGIPADDLLFRDHNSEHDPVMPKDGTIDLAEGNVFYSEPGCGDATRPACEAPAKLAYVVNDRWEIFTNPNQTGRMLRDFFALTDDVELFRDLKSPDDQSIGDADTANFVDGCVFRTHERKHTLRIFVNKLPFTEHDGVKPEMTGLEIAKLVENKPENTRVTKITEGQDTPIELNLPVKITSCDQFKVIRNNVNAGFQPERIDRELAILRQSGVRVTFVSGQMPAVIYHDMPVKTGKPVGTTDVLVKVPSGYPGGVIDNAFLPEGSPLLNCTPGSPQDTASFEGHKWTQKSIHPHATNAIPWDKDKHGFHTYYGEMLHWLNQ